MSTKPKAGSPDELVWLRGFEEARNHFLVENVRLREALKRITEASMPHEEPVSQAIARAALEGK